MPGPSSSPSPPASPPFPLLPSIAVVVVHYGREDLTDRALRSIEAIPRPAFDLILVDNGSGDGSGESLARRHPACLLTRIEENAGFAGGANHGLALALGRGAEFILLVSNDVEVDPGILEGFLGACRDPAFSPAGLCVPKVFFADRPEVLWYAGGEMDPRTGLCRPWGLGRPDGPRFSFPRECSFGNGCVIFLPASTLREVGMLDTRYHHTGEDADLSVRVRARGLRILFVPEARVWHRVRGTSSGGQGDREEYLYYEYRNRVLLYARHFAVGAGSLPALLLAGHFLRGILGRLRRGDRGGAAAILRGWRDGRAGVVGKAWRREKGAG